MHDKKKTKNTDSDFIIVFILFGHWQIGLIVIYCFFVKLNRNKVIEQNKREITESKTYVIYM